jgi:CBS domain-containing protein
MILGGLWLGFTQQMSFINGLWFAILGWFLFSAAGSEELQTRLQRSLAGIKVRDVMTPNPITAPDWTTVDDFISRFANVYRATAYPLRDFSGQISGLISIQDLGRLPAHSRMTARLRDIAHPLTTVVTARPEDEVVSLLQNFEDPEAGYALVMDAGQLVGLVTPGDIRRVLDLGRLQVRRAATRFSRTT